MPPKQRNKKKSPFSQPNALCQEAQRLVNAGHFASALRRVEKILKNHPQHQQALYLMGLALYELGKPEAAIAALEKAAALAPDDPKVLFNVGFILQKKGQNVRALTHYQKSLLLDPNNAHALSNLGALLLQGKDLDGALAANQRAIDLQPSLGEAHINLGETHRAMGHFDAAIQSYLKGLQLCPDLFKIHNNLGALYKAKGELTKAQAAYQKAIDIAPSFAPPYLNLGTALLEQGKLDEAQAWFQKAFTVDPTLTKAWQNALMATNYSDQLSPGEIFHRHREWGEWLEQQTEQERHRHRRTIPPDRRIRIGYVSPDFWQHAVASFIEPILSAHDHSRFEIVCYADTEYPDQLTLRMEQMADKWHDIRELSDTELAALVVADGIDILVDLTGHTGRNRLAMFALQPAPIQVTYLGYPNTTGLKTMDYRLTDHFADPVGMTEALHTETLIRLPHCFLCYSPPTEDLPIDTLPSLKNGHITFGSFNKRPKITDAVINCWAEILRRTPDSRLVLKSSPLQDAPTRECLLQKFTDLGIAADRLVILAHVPSFAAHMALYNTIDIGLDTFPYNGTTTTFEALWMGVPVITLAGQSHVSRVGLSILSQLDLGECIAKDQEEYIRVATALAQDTDRLQTLRNELRQRLAASPWCDKQHFVQDLETAYLDMVAAWNQKVSPPPFEDKSTSPEAGSDSQAALRLNQSGEQLFAMGKLAEAEQTFRKAIERDPQLEDAHNNLGVILWQTGDTQGALASLMKALQLNPTNLNTIDNLSAILAAEGGQQASSPAHHQAKKTITFYPNSQSDNQGSGSPPQDHQDLNGEELFSQQRYDAAAEAFRRAIEQNPNDEVAHNNLGVTAWQLGDLQLALRSFQKALALNPTYLDAIDNLQAVLEESTRTGTPTRPQGKPIIRIIHNLARSGGTLMSKCLGCMEGVTLLSEIHPLGTRWFNPLHQASEWFHLLSPEEIAAIDQQGGLPFPEAIRLIQQKCVERGRNLVIRDWSHLDFMGVPFLKNTTDRFSINDALAGEFEIKEISITRHPIDQWLSLSRLQIMQGQITLEAFLKGYRKFAEHCMRTGFIRYEDFIDKPEDKMKEMCYRLALPYDPAFIDNWWKYETISGDTRSKRGAKKEIKHVPRYPVAEELLANLAQNVDYRESIAALGYEHPGHSSQGTTPAPLPKVNLVGASKKNEQPWQDLFDKVVVISLPACSERRKYIEKHLPEVGIHSFEFFDATSADDFSVNLAYDRGEVATFPPCFRCGKLDCGNPDCNNFLIPQQVATFITYMNLWKSLARGKAERILVLEDDVRIHRHGRRVLSWLSQEIAQKTVPFRGGNACLLRLGWALSPDHAATTDRCYVNDTVKMSNPCHAITRDYAKLLLKRYRGIVHTVDVYQHQLAPKPGESFTLFPPIASELSWTDGVFASTIHPKQVHSQHLRSVGDFEGAKRNEQVIQKHIKKKYYRPLLIVSHPRCGTGYAASLCQQLGVDVGHEKLGKDGISSWMFAVEDDEVPYALDTVARSRRALAWEYLVMPVRNLANAVGSVIRESVYAPPSFDFRRKHILRLRHIDLERFNSPLERAIWSITSWYRIILDQHPDLWFRIEDQHEQLKLFLIEKNLCLSRELHHTLDTSPVNANKLYRGVSYPKPIITALEWESLPDESKTEITWFCEKFGYPSPLNQPRG